MGCTIDHILIAVHDIEAAQAAYTVLLGRAPSWHGQHPMQGSVNCLFRLDNIYIELLAATDSGDTGALVRAHLATQGEGLLGIAFAHDEPDKLRGHMKAHGITAGATQAGCGVDDLSGAVRHWTNMFWPSPAGRGVFSFAITHRGDADDFGGLPLAPAIDVAPFTACDHVVLQTRDADAAAQFYGDVLGLRLAARQSRPQWGGEMLFFRSRHMSLEVIASTKHDATRDFLWGIAFKTDDIEATHARLLAANVSVSEIRTGRKVGTRVATIKSHILSIPTLLIEHH